MPTLKDFAYQLPPELIAHSPSPKRDHCRLLVFHRSSMTWQHHFFYELPTLLRQTGKRYLIIRNNSRVIPARIWGKKSTGGQVEVLLIREQSQTSHSCTWQCLTKPGLTPQTQLIFPSLTATCQTLPLYQDSYSRLLEFHASPTAFAHFLLTQGHTPIPPYLKTTLPEKRLRQVYQTIYAQKPGSVAAPTAGLHFTNSLFQTLQADGHSLANLTLHVGPGTFLPVKTVNLNQHQLHQEFFSVPTPTKQKIRLALQTHQPILAIGTTSTRVLESLSNQDLLDPHPIVSASTQIFLHPPVLFRHTHALITNFHLPHSTLLMLAAAFTSSPNTTHSFTTWKNSPLAKAYQDAITNHYRFFSFGDAMLIL